MTRRRLRWQLFPTYLAGMWAVTAVAWWIAASAVDRVSKDRAQAALEPIAQRVVESLAGRELKASSELSELCQSLARDDELLLLVLNARGRVLANTGPQKITKVSDPESVVELNDALQGRIGFNTRYDYPTPRRLAHLTLPIHAGGEKSGDAAPGEVIGVVRASLSLETADRIGSALSVGAVALAILSALGGAVAAAWGALRVNASLDVVRAGLDRFAQGELGYRVKLAPVEEVSQLSEQLNRLAGKLGETLGGMSRNVNSLHAVLASMAEGVLAIDTEGRIITLNHATCQLLGINEKYAVGLKLEEVVRSQPLRRFIQRAASEPAAIVDDIEVQGDRRHVLQVRGSSLRNGDGLSLGAVIVLNDVSEFRRLEHVRRDFVANVSHELKTPVASIKGFSETLLDGALDNPEDARRFLEIIAKQADRLNAIIEDLLSLSRIEQGEETAAITFERSSIHSVLSAAVSDREPVASERQVSLELDCDERLAGTINPPLLEQAVTNLIDNAIKYSDPGSQVRVVGSQQNGEVTIAVSDRGCGIDAEHIPRIFERFYRVDKARSRKLGGTGLGLAIVKHIVQAHHGRVTVESKPGQGSTFTLYLPAK